MTIAHVCSSKVKTLMIQLKPLEERFKRPEQGEGYQNALVSVLAKFSSLEAILRTSARPLVLLLLKT